MNDFGRSSVFKKEKPDDTNASATYGPGTSLTNWSLKPTDIGDGTKTGGDGRNKNNFQRTVDGVQVITCKNPKCGKSFLKMDSLSRHIAHVPQCKNIYVKEYQIMKRPWPSVTSENITVYPQGRSNDISNVNGEVSWPENLSQEPALNLKDKNGYYTCKNPNCHQSFLKLNSLVRHVGHLKKCKDIYGPMFAILKTESRNITKRQKNEDTNEFISVDSLDNDVTAQNGKVSENSNDSEDREGIFTCQNPDCRKSFVKLSSLLRHIGHVPECKMTYGFKYDIMKREGKKLVKKLDLESHEKLPLVKNDEPVEEPKKEEPSSFFDLYMREEQNFTCENPECGKAFGQLSSLIRHVGHISQCKSYYGYMLDILKREKKEKERKERKAKARDRKNLENSLVLEDDEPVNSISLPTASETSISECDGFDKRETAEMVSCILSEKEIPSIAKSTSVVQCKNPDCGKYFLRLDSLQRHVNQLEECRKFHPKTEFEQDKVKSQTVKKLNSEVFGSSGNDILSEEIESKVLFCRNPSCKKPFLKMESLLRHIAHLQECKDMYGNEFEIMKREKRNAPRRKRQSPSPVPNKIIKMNSDEPTEMSESGGSLENGDSLDDRRRYQEEEVPEDQEEPRDQREEMLSALLEPRLETVEDQKSHETMGGSSSKLWWKTENVFKNGGKSFNGPTSTKSGEGEVPEKLLSAITKIWNMRKAPPKAVP